jgi:hypothetical protein
MEQFWLNDPGHFQGADFSSQFASACAIAISDLVQLPNEPEKSSIDILSPRLITTSNPVVGCVCDWRLDLNFSVGSGFSLSLRIMVQYVGPDAPDDFPEMTQDTPT